MIHSFTRVTVVKVRKPSTKGVNEDLKWLGSSLGLFSIRDKNSSCFRVFIELLKNARHGKAVSSDELAFKTGLSRGTVVHHLHSLISAGLVVPEDNKYLLREANLRTMISDVRKDINDVLESLNVIAEELDSELNMEKK